MVMMYDSIIAKKKRKRNDRKFVLKSIEINQETKNTSYFRAKIHENTATTRKLATRTIYTGKTKKTQLTFPFN